AVTADAVRASLERALRPSTGAPELVVSALRPISGFDAFAANRDPGARLLGVSAPSASVVHVDLDSPLSTLPAILANPVFGVVEPGETFAASGLLATSGPFRVTTRSSARLALRRATGASTYIDGIDVTLTHDLAAGYRALRAG